MVLSNKKLTGKERGFTIVELLVVIVVIGILAAITIVSYTGISAKANKNANLSVATQIRNAANIVFANTSAFPATAAVSATVVTNLNASDAKIGLPTGASVTSTTSTSNLTFSYRLKGSTGFCVGYWDPTASTPAPAYIFGGDATADNGTACS